MNTIKCEVEIKVIDLPIIKDLRNTSSELFHILYHLNDEGAVPKEAWVHINNLLSKFLALDIYE